MLRLNAPLEQVGQQNTQTAEEFAAFALAHVFQLLSNVLDVGFVKAPGAQERGVVGGPLEEIEIVEIPRARLQDLSLHILKFSSLPRRRRGGRAAGVGGLLLVS